MCVQVIYRSVRSLAFDASFVVSPPQLRMHIEKVFVGMGGGGVVFSLAWSSSVPSGYACTLEIIGKPTLFAPGMIALQLHDSLGQKEVAVVDGLGAPPQLALSACSRHRKVPHGLLVREGGLLW